MSIPNTLPKIAIFVPATAIGGAEHYIKNILYLIEEIGFEPTLILPKEDLVISFFADLKVNYLICDLAWSGSEEDLKVGNSYLNKLSKQYRETIKVLESLKPDCAFVNLPWVDFGLGISLACHSMGISCINLVHLCPWKVNLNDLTKQIFQDLASASNSFFTVSQDNRIQLSLSTGIDPDAIEVFYNSRDIVSGYTSLTTRQYRFHRLELLDELELPLKSFLSLSVGRFSHQKNFLDIITSFASIYRKLPDYYHIFLGEGNLKDYYQKAVFDLGLSDRIKFLGYRKDVPKFLALSDLFISTSLYEGLALSLLEAAQFLCPIIATNSSSAKEIIPSSDYGLLYNPGQYYLLAKYIEFAYFNPHEMKQKALKLKSLCQEKFSLTQFKSNLKTILQNTVNKKISQESDISVLYDRETKKLKLNKNLNVHNDRDRASVSSTLTTPNLMPLSVDDYASQVLKKSHSRYLHSLYKIAKKFFNTKVILCYGSFNTRFFRSCYLKEQYLLCLISLDKPDCITLSLHNIDRTYWGQDIEPDCIAKFTSFEQVNSFQELTDMDLERKTKHFYTFMSSIKNYLKSSDNNNLNINLKMIDTIFQPSQYYLLENNSTLKKMEVS